MNLVFAVLVRIFGAAASPMNWNCSLGQPGRRRKPTNRREADLEATALRFAKATTDPVAVSLPLLGNGSRRQRELQTTGRGTFGPGEAFQFDWSEDWAIIGNECTKLQVAHTKRSYSSAFIVRAYFATDARDAVLMPTKQALRVFVVGGRIYDNMCTAIDEVGRGMERDVNVCFRPCPATTILTAMLCSDGGGRGPSRK
ncbi:hypothetical protein [Rhizobium sp. YTU87027]|uniref:hypothetical protein n=1 Tax=Rhizobium sp. YTU87027 TaxID=3417741 RepID=UPI003D684EC8